MFHFEHVIIVNVTTCVGIAVVCISDDMLVVHRCAIRSSVTFLFGYRWFFMVNLCRRLSVAAQNCGIGLLETSLVTPTAVASVSSIEYVADPPITERSVIENKGDKSGIGCDNTGGRRTTKRSNNRQFSSGKEGMNRHTATGLCFKETKLLAVDKKGASTHFSGND